MCIVCNMPQDIGGFIVADKFLIDFKSSQKAMADAVKAMLVASKTAVTPEDRKRYDRMHKRMKHILRDWNNIEHARDRRAGALRIRREAVKKPGHLD